MIFIIACYVFVLLFSEFVLIGVIVEVTKTPHKISNWIAAMVIISFVLIEFGIGILYLAKG